MDEEALRNCLILSNLAYRDSFPHKLLGFDHVTPIHHGDTQMYIVEDRDSVYYAFRGTETDEWGDILTDLKITKKDFKLGHLHRGFYEAFSKIRDELAQVRKDRRLKKKKVYITGHSLGGALGRIFAESLKDVTAIHTFGEPRSGCADLASTYKHHDKHYRWVMHNDIFTRLPLVSMNFKHVGKMIYIDSHNKICPAASTTKQTWEFIKGGLFAKLKNHGIEAYIKTLGPLFIKNRGNLKNL
jgi:triacylglycerol lipase